MTTAAFVSTADRLGSTAFLAALAHGVVILGITFSSDPLTDSEALPSLNVTLLVDSRDAERSDADMLAQRDHTGGGLSKEELRAATTLAAQQPLSQLGDPAGADLEDGTPSEPLPLADQLMANRPTDNPRTAPSATARATEMPEKAAALLNRPTDQTLVTEIDLQAALPTDTANPNATGPSTRASALAAYLVGWRQRVERIGTANFPERFLRPHPGLGRPMLEVAIGAEGRLEDIVVRRSSGDTTLDQAALKILRLAAPFEPLPPSLLAEHDVLRFAYEWEFSVGESAAPPTAGLN